MRNPQRRSAVAGVALLALGLPATAARAAAAAVASAAVTAFDDVERRVELSGPARRIISLSPSITEQLFAIGAGDRVVGTSEYSDYPPAAQRLPRVARAQAVDLERVAELAPDLIVTWGSGYSSATFDALVALGRPVFVSEPRTLESIGSSLERLGRLAGTDGAAAARAFGARLQALRSSYQQRAPVTVFFQVWAKPLLTLSGQHLVSAAIRVCGGRNVFENLGPLVPEISAEAVLSADPQMLITAEAGAVDRGALDFWRGFPTLRAVASRRLITLDADKLNRSSPRILDEIAVLCERIDATRQ